MRPRTILPALILLLPVAGCGGSGSGGGGSDGGAPGTGNALTGFYPATRWLLVGQEAPLAPSWSVPGLPPVALAWESADPSIATVDASGTVSGIAPGRTTVTAHPPSHPGNVASAEVIVTASADETEILGVGSGFYAYPWEGGSRQEPHPQPEGLWDCRGVAVAPGGKVYVLASWSIWCVDRLNGSLSLVKAFATEAEDPIEGYGNMGSLAIDSAGRLYTVGFTNRPPGDVILRYDPATGQVIPFAEVPYQVGLVLGLDVDSNDNLYATGTLPSGSIVTRFSPGGVPVIVLPNYLGDIGGAGLDVVGDGSTIYVAVQHDLPYPTFGIYRCVDNDADPEFDVVESCASPFTRIVGLLSTADGLLVAGSLTIPEGSNLIYRLRDDLGTGFYPDAERSLWSDQGLYGGNTRVSLARLNPW